MSIEIAGVRVDNLDMKGVVSEIEKRIEVNDKSKIYTPNLDFLYNASKSGEFKRILNDSDLNIPDGKPLIWLSRLNGESLKEKVAGSDLFIELCKLSNLKGYRIFILGAEEGVPDKAIKNLTNTYGDINCVGFYSPPFGFEKNIETLESIISKINSTKPDILFVALGSPKQEFFIDKYFKRLNSIVSIGVGASIDFAAGVKSKPPHFVKEIGMAWLWRALSEPKRLGIRYLKNITFFIKYLTSVMLNKM
ncbi:MAG: WecB/TagA/CpsF family glycosyltransferase [Balneola sp.]